MPISYTDAYPLPVFPPPHVSGRFYDSIIATGATTTLVLSVNTLYGVYFTVPKRATYVVLQLEVSSAAAAGKLLRLGIYNDSDGVPGSLVLDGGTVLADATGSRSVVISQVLNPGGYWLAVVSDGTPTVRANNLTSGAHWHGFTSGTDVTVHMGWSVAFTFAALPTPFTAGGALMTVSAPKIQIGT